MNKEETKEEPIIVPEIEEVKEPEMFVDVPFDPIRTVDKLYIGTIAGITKIKVLATDAQEIPNNTDTKVQFSSEVYDELNEFDSTTNYRFTCLRDGTYIISANIALNYALTDQQIMKIYIYKNGTVASQHWASQSGILDQYAAITDFFQLVIGDYIEIYVYHNKGSSAYIDSFPVASGITSFLNIHQIS